MFYTGQDCDLAAFKTLIDQTLDASDVPLASTLSNNIPIYDAGALDLSTSRDALKNEFNWVLGQGPGVLAIKGSYPDTAPLDQAAGIFNQIIAAEKESSAGGGDHFAEAGANDRIWNSLQKLCIADPAVYAANFCNPFMALVSEAWLGPSYQMTAQVNLVRPGGKAQTAHRDYHLGFMSEERALQFPAHAHDLSPMLTLQGAIAHCDMPIESGPTKLLPYSQLYGPGYLAYRRPEFSALFEERFVQLPLEKGDLLFFNPALFHGAGDNVSDDIQRLANLVQVGSAMGRSIETVDRVAMAKAVYPTLQSNALNLSTIELDALMGSTVEGYAFPTNLDLDQPVTGLNPPTQAEILTQALAEDWTVEAFNKAMDDMVTRKSA